LLQCGRTGTKAFNSVGPSGLADSFMNIKASLNGRLLFLGEASFAVK
jgi:hypothetical protein